MVLGLSACVLGGLTVAPQTIPSLSEMYRTSIGCQGGL
jgi:hypothetical protein